MQFLVVFLHKKFLVYFPLFELRVCVCACVRFAVAVSTFQS